MASVAHQFLLVATHSFFFHGADAAITCAEATTCADCLVASSSWLGSPCQWCTTGRLPATPCLSTTRLGGMLACALEGGPVEDRGGWTSVCPTTTTTTTTTRSPTSRAAATLQGIVDDPTTATTAAEIVAAMTFVVDAGLGSPALGPSMDAAVCVFYDKLTRYMIAGYAADRSTTTRRCHSRRRRSRRCWRSGWSRRAAAAARPRSAARPASRGGSRPRRAPTPCSTDS